MNLPLIQLAARASAAAYAPDPAMELNRQQIIAGVPGEGPLQSRVTDAIPIAENCHIIQTQDTVIVAFRGSANLHDWFTDLDAVFVPSGIGGKVHLGFRQCFEQIKKKIAPGIRALRDKHQPVLFTGHSLGGAMAALAALDNCSLFFDDISVITFGQPRVGNGEFTLQAKRDFDFYGISYHRIVNTRDIVPRVPLLQGRHFGDVTILDQTGARTQIPFIEKAIQDIGSLYNIGKFVAARANPNNAISEIIGIDDLVVMLLHEHSMALYQTRLDRLAQSQITNFKTEIAAPL